MNSMKNQKWKSILSNFLLLLFAGVILLPLFLIFVSSFMQSDEAALTYGGVLDGRHPAFLVLMPARPSFKPFADLLLFCRQFYTMFWNSVKYTVLITVGQLFISIPAAWAFAKLWIPLKKLVFTMYIVLMMLPFQVTMLSNYFMLDRMELLHTPWAFILPCVFSTFPVFVLTRFFGDIPNELTEAARADGAGCWQVFWFIGLPLGKSGIAAVTVLQILEIWNAIEQPMFFIQDEAYFPLSLFFPNLTPDTFGSSFVAAMVMMLPPVLIFLHGRKELESGIGHIGVEK